MKKVISVLCMIVLCMGFVPTTAHAAEMVPFEGEGTQENPWLIQSAEDLVALASFVNDGKAAGYDTGSEDVGNFYGYYFKQTANIDMQGVNFEPIGYSENCYFAGNYDGDNHIIKNIVCNGKVDEEGYSSAGVFGWVAFGSVSRLNVVNAKMTAIGVNRYSYAGGLCGVVLASTISECSVRDSKIESQRNNNNNCAGGLAGYVTGSTIKQCAAENNEIQTMAYAGGLVGELDDDNGVGTSDFVDCYAAGSKVKAYTKEVQGSNCVGAFIGEVTSSDLNAKNCFVYDVNAVADESTAAYYKGVGVFAGNIHGSSYQVVATNCYYGAITLSGGNDMSEIKAGAATEKSEAEFADGTVQNLLGASFSGTSGYPFLSSRPADYTAVEEASAKANAVTKSLYKNYNKVEAALNAVVEGKLYSEQSEVDAMAQAIEQAIAALEYKDADYSAVDAAIAKANALVKADYKDFTGVESAIAAVVRNKKITEQSEVDAMAAAIEQALTKLEKKENNTVTPPEPNDPSKPNNPSGSNDPSGSSNPSGSNNSTGSDNPTASNEPTVSGTGTENVQQAQLKTGDNNAVLPAIVLMILSGIGMSGIMVYYRKR